MHNSLEILQDIAPPHLSQAEQETTGIIEHDSWPASGINQFSDEIGHSAITPGEDGAIMVFVNILMINHVLQIADQGASMKVAFYNQRLVHV